MARVSNNYDPESYGQSFELIPPGIYRMVIESGYVDYDKNGNQQWVIDCQFISSQFRSNRTLKVWLNEDGCINALADGMAMDIRKFNPDAEYQPQSFKKREIWVEIYHKSPKDSDKVFANIKRIWPAFNRGIPPRDGISREDMEKYLRGGGNSNQQTQRQHDSQALQDTSSPRDDFNDFGPAIGKDDLPF